MPEPLVTVCIITYNHREYVASAIDGALMQQADFPYEILIGEDESQDGTREVCINYAERYPDRIRLFLRSRDDVIHINGHATGRFNFVESLKACGGKYIALCEGDDYWTDPQKLQKQVDFLDSHPECSMSFHNTSIKFQDSMKVSSLRYLPGQKTIWTLEDILYRNPITTCSAVFRNGIVNQLPQWFFALPMGDWPLWVLLTQHGPAGYLDDDMATYRVHKGGVFSGRRSREWIPTVLSVYETFDEAFDGAYHDLIIQGKIGYLDSVAEEFMEESRLATSQDQAVRDFCDLWRRHTGKPPPSERELLGRLYVHRFFRAAMSHDYEAMRSCVLPIAKYDKSWFLNRGFLSSLWIAASSWK